MPVTTNGTTLPMAPRLAAGPTATYLTWAEHYNSTMYLVARGVTALEPAMSLATASTTRLTQGDESDVRNIGKIQVAVTPDGVLGAHWIDAVTGSGWFASYAIGAAARPASEQELLEGEFVAGDIAYDPATQSFVVFSVDAGTGAAGASIVSASVQP